MTPIGWRIPFSEERSHGYLLAHYLVNSRFPGFTERLCRGGEIVNSESTSPVEGADRRCGSCERALRAATRIAFEQESTLDP